MLAIEEKGCVDVVGAPVTDPSVSKKEFNLGAWRKFALVFLPSYLIWTHIGIGLRLEHFLISIAFCLLFWWKRTAQFAVMALPFFVVGLLYDNLRLVIGIRGEIHVADLYNAELAWFGVETAAGRKILPDVLSSHPIAFLDLICGVAYLAYLVESFGFGIYLFFRDRPLMSRFGWAFLLVNLSGMITYVLYPAAPPWYVDQYGLGPAQLDAMPSAAGAARFDQLLGVTIFESFYSRNANVFGAMPSLHCAYPAVVACAAVDLAKRGTKKTWLLTIAALLFALLVCFSAVYLQHHYVLDVLAGILFALASYGVILAFEKFWSGKALGGDKKARNGNTSENQDVPRANEQSTAFGGERKCSER